MNLKEKANVIMENSVITVQFKMLNNKRKIQIVWTLKFSIYWINLIAYIFDNSKFLIYHMRWFLELGF